MLLCAILIVVIDWIVLRGRGFAPSGLTAGAGAAALAGVLSLRSRRWREFLARPELCERFDFASVFVLFLALYSVTRSTGPTPYNEHVRLAYALLHGHVWVDAPPWIESVAWHGRRYLVHPPLAAVVLMPLVALTGMATDQVAVSVVIGALDVALAWRLLGRFDLAASARLWLTLFFGVGTILWYEATEGTSWTLPLVLSVAPTLCALDELFGEARPWLVGVMAGLAALARYDLAAVWPVYALALLNRGRRWRELGWMLPGLGFAAVAYAAYSEARFGTALDPGIWLWYQADSFGRRSHPGLPSPFALHNLPSNLYTLLFMSPAFDGVFPYIHPRGTGQALILTSPAFLLALRPALSRPMTLLMWLAAALSMGGVLLYYANGFQQFGTRFYVQAFPFLLVLMALGNRRRADQLTRLLIAASMVLVAYGVWHIRLFGFA